MPYFVATPRVQAAEHFESEVSSYPQLEAARIPIASVLQRFEYERERNVELWRICCRNPAVTRSPVPDSTTEES